MAGRCTTIAIISSIFIGCDDPPLRVVEPYETTRKVLVKHKKIDEMFIIKALKKMITQKYRIIIFKRKG
jgi:hypothetical protein